jgi:CubicO group peptidase (beta-lactamase class C family)
VPTPTIFGNCDAAFRGVHDAFANNFSENDEIGACVAISVGGALVVDLWGGRADPRGRLWERDTIVDVFSVGKAMVALALLVLVERRQLDIDDPVALHWPEFAAEGKGAVTVAQLMSHQAGLPGIRHPLTPGAMYDWDLMTGALAKETPWWEPGTALGYHVNTLGFLGGELVRRVSGEPFNQFFTNEVARPLGADFTFGLGPAEDARVADFQFPESASFPTVQQDSDDATFVYANPPGASGIGLVNSRAWRAAVHPSSNGHSNARAIARIYGLLAAGGSLDDVRLLGSTTLDAATAELSLGHDRILERRSRFGFGFELTMPERPLGPGPASFGHYGAGGSLGMADPDAGLAFGYCMNRFGLRWQDPRNKALVNAAYACL